MSICERCGHEHGVTALDEVARWHQCIANLRTDLGAARARSAEWQAKASDLANQKSVDDLILTNMEVRLREAEAAYAQMRAVLEQLNEPQLETLRRLCEMMPQAHMVDVTLRIGGLDKHIEADFLRDLLPAWQALATDAGRDFLAAVRRLVEAVNALLDLSFVVPQSDAPLWKELRAALAEVAKWTSRKDGS